MTPTGLFLAGNRIPPLPLDFITESSAILAKKGAGKTNAAIVLAEEVYQAGAPVVTIDPKGDHWGIRAGADGQRDGGLPFVVLGGLHGDVPLEPTAGAYIAELLRERHLSAVLDVSEFTVGERARFLTAFADRLYRYDSHEPMLLVLEEAHEYIPQRVGADEAKMVGAFERLVKLGRHKGLGVVMVTQRSASLNKNVLTQADNLFVLRTTAPQDRAVVKAWLDSNADPAIASELGSLATGECVLVQPERGEPLRFQLRMRHTYDAGRTPKVGESPRPPATLADVDLEEVAAAMAETIERAKADDPKALRARITALERDLAAARAEQPVPEPVRVEVPVFDMDGLHALARDVEAATDRMTDAVRDALARAGGDDPRPVIPRAPEPKREVIVFGQEGRRTTAKRVTANDDPMSKAERAVLTALVQFGPLSLPRLSLLSGYKIKSSSLSNALGALRSAGRVNRGQPIEATDQGVADLGPVDALPTGEEFIAYWMGRLGRAERAILEYLIEAWPGARSNEQISEATGYSVTSSSLSNALGALRSLTLISGDRRANVADDMLGEARHPR